MSIIETLLTNYADINHREEQTGFNCLMMACHLNTENDALQIIKLLCQHKFYDSQERCVDINAQDFALNTTLHHAVLTGKLSICQYLINEQQCDTTQKNA